MRKCEKSFPRSRKINFPLQHLQGLPAENVYSLWGTSISFADPEPYHCTICIRIGVYFTIS